MHAKSAMRAIAGILLAATITAGCSGSGNGNGGGNNPPPPPPALTISGAALADGVVGVPYNQTIAATGGTGARTFSLSAGGLPDGLSLNAGNGVVSGTPLGPIDTADFTVAVTDSGTPQQGDLQALSITINAAVAGRNDSIADATPLGNGTFAASISPSGHPNTVFDADEDYYAITTTAASTVTVDINADVNGSPLDSVIEIVGCERYAAEYLHTDAARSLTGLRARRRGTRSRPRFDPASTDCRPDDLLYSRRGFRQQCPAGQALRPRHQRSELTAHGLIAERPRLAVMPRGKLRGARRRLAVIAVSAEPAPNGRNIVLVTLDGVRVQELFGGLDDVIADAPEAESGIYEIDVTRERYGRATAKERREALMPFFWKTLAPAGMVLGNQALGSKVTVTNDQWFSYPGYSEILTGQAQPEIKSNDFVRYPHETVLDYVHRKLNLKPTEVAQIGSWDGFKYAASQKDGTFFMSGAYGLVPRELSTPEIDLLGSLRRQVIENWEESSNDAMTFHIALGLPKETPAARALARPRPVGRLGACPPLRRAARLPAPRRQLPRRTLADAAIARWLPRQHDPDRHDRSRPRPHARRLGRP